MKKILFLLLIFTSILQAQTYPVNPTKFGKISLNTNVEDNAATKVNVQSANGEINWVNKSILSNKFTVQNPIYYKGKNIYWFGDSYTAGSGASPVANRFTTLVSNALGAIEVNQGVAGTTMEKRVPINYMAGPNMVDNVVNIPTKTASMAMLVFGFGLNDMGQTAPAYSTANYKTDYQTVLNNAFSKGWLPNQILIIPAYYIGSAGYAAYATITGNAAPDVTRHLAFIQAAKEVAEANGTMYFDIYQDQKKNDITLISADNIHPNNAGYAYIANDILQYLGADKLSITTDTGYSTGSGFLPKINVNKLDNSYLYQNSIGIGLATQSPKVGWHIHSASNTSSFMMTHTGTTDALARGVLFGLDTGLNFFINNRENAPIYFATNNSERFRINAGGGISVGNTIGLGLGTGNFSGNVRTIDAVNNLDAVTLQQMNAANALKANDNAVVHIAGTENITGQKNFSSSTSGVSAIGVTTTGSSNGQTINNAGTGIGLVGINASSGVFASINSNTGSTGDLYQFLKNSVLMSKIDQNGRYSLAGATGNALLMDDGTTIVAINYTITSASTLSLTSGSIVNYYEFTGTTATWTLPSPAVAGRKISMLNKGSGTVTVNTSGGTNTIYNSGVLTNTYALISNTNYEFISNGTVWNKL